MTGNAGPAGSEASGRPFREVAKEHFVRAFGEPQHLPTEAGDLYRWVIPIPGTLHTANVYVTIDSPEMPDIAHVLISDPAAGAVEPISSIITRSLEDVDRLIERIKRRVSAS